MTIRLLFAAVLVAGGLFAGCKGGPAGGPAGDADLSGIAEADAADQLAYNAGFETAAQLLQQDSTFSFERFRDGFLAGLRGDSTEIAYALGLRAGLGLRADTVANIDANVFLTGFREGLNRDSVRLNPQQIARANASFQDTMQVRQLRQRARTDSTARTQLRDIRTNATAAERFLAEVARRPGVQKTASGVLYTVKTPGSGASPGEQDRVKIIYVGRLADGTEFDKSPEGEPVEFPAGAFVPGFSEMLMAMKPGESRTIYLPPSLAYGMMGSPGPNGEGGIPPNAALEFDLTLVEVLPGSGQPQMGFPGM
jgi:FKBP-type peptidyl-prolyl cis-trans isomerase